MDLVVVGVVVLVVLVSTPVVERPLVDRGTPGVFLDHLRMLFDDPL